MSARDGGDQHARIALDLAESKRYSETAGTSGKSVQWIEDDLRAYDLTGALLIDAVLDGTNFSGCAMVGANLAAAWAGGVTFERAQLRDVNLEKAMLEGACFDEAIADGVRFRKANLQHASLQRARLVGAVLDGANASNATFRDADLRNASLWKTALSDANLSGVNLAGARIEHTLMDGAVLTGATGIDAARVVSIDLDGALLDADKARTWLVARATAT